MNGIRISVKLMLILNLLYFYFPFCRENIVFKINFQNWIFEIITHFEGLWKFRFLTISVCVAVGVGVSINRSIQWQNIARKLYLFSKFTSHKDT